MGIVGGGAMGRVANTENSLYKSFAEGLGSGDGGRGYRLWSRSQPHHQLYELGQLILSEPSFHHP